MPKRTFTTTIDFDLDPITFVLDGRRTSGEHEEWSEEFTILPAIPHGSVAKMLRMQTIDKKGRIGWDADILTQFILSLLDEDSAERFGTLAEDPDRIVETRTIADVAMWIVSDVAARPTRPSSASSPGTSPDANGSTDSSSEQLAPPVLPQGFVSES